MKTKLSTLAKRIDAWDSALDRRRLTRLGHWPDKDQARNRVSRLFAARLASLGPVTYLPSATFWK